jgi:hypothetical protein
MAKKSNLKQFQTVTNGNMASAITSPVTSIEFLDNIGMQLNFTGSPTGIAQVQVSLDYNQDINGNVINPGNWVPVVFPSIGSDISLSSGSPIFIDLNQLSAPYVRLYYSGGGTGVLNAYVGGKVI